ncbi:MAG: hypothetical protein OK456_04910 [Thaumarchaeota archaeon]|nr:hypothetical protein [Nitrososphaerota archaeon]
MLALVAVFSIPVALAAVSESIAVDLLVYLLVCLEGLALASIAMSKITSTTDQAGLAADAHSLDRKYVGVDKVGMIAESVRSAAKGWEISRREIARILSRTMEDYGTAAPLVDHPEILSYAQGNAPSASSERPRAKPLGREEYLTGLEEVVTKLERGASAERPMSLSSLIEERSDAVATP